MIKKVILTFFILSCFIFWSCKPKKYENTTNRPSHILKRDNGGMGVDHIYFTPNLHIESSSGLQFTDSTIIHESNEEANLITVPIEFDVLFHEMTVTYEVSDLLVPIGGISEHVQKLEMYFRFADSNDEWTDWHSLSNLRGLDDMEMRFLMRYNPARISMFDYSLFEFAQVKIVSVPENQGKMIIKDLRFGVLKQRNVNRSKKKTKTIKRDKFMRNPF